MKYVLLDIEGTTSPIEYVHEVLFPYSFEKLDNFLASNRDSPVVRRSLEGVKDSLVTEGRQPPTSIGEYAHVLKEWIKADRKHPALKELQGLIWKIGFESGELKGHVYDEVPTALIRWTGSGLRVGIYSSGSVLAQRLYFKHSNRGDLTGFISDHFDTAVGNKREVDSYKRIAAHIGVEGKDILFLSDTLQELSAARAAGFQTRLVVREKQGVIPSFDESWTDFSHDVG